MKKTDENRSAKVISHRNLVQNILFYLARLKCGGRCESILGNTNHSTTLEAIIPKLKALMTENLKCNIVDSGYKGKKEIEGIGIIVPNPKKDSMQSVEYQNNKRRQCKSRTAIKPIIEHHKNDHRMLRNFLKGVQGDKINAILAGAALNFKKALYKINAFDSIYLRFLLNKFDKQQNIIIDF